MRLGLSLGSGRPAVLSAADPLEPSVPDQHWIQAPVPGHRTAAAILGARHDDTAGDEFHYRSTEAAWMGVIRGSAAELTVFSKYGRDHADFAFVTVDGTPSAQALPVTDGRLQLFSGLPDEPHFVSIEPEGAFGGAITLPTDETGLTVTGSDPAARLALHNYHFADPAVGTVSPLMTSVEGPDYAPGLTLDTDAALGAVFPVMAFRGAFSELFLASRPQASSTSAYISVDGGPPAIIDFVSGAARFTPPPGTHDFIIFTEPSGRFISVGTHEEAELVPRPPMLLHLGHSIVEGVLAKDTEGKTRRGVRTDMPRTAIRNGYLPVISGIAGNTLANLDARIDQVLAALEVTSTDVAVLDIGRNDGAAAMSPTEEALYASLIDRLEAAGFGKILCLGVMPLGTDFSAFNQSVADLVATRNNPEVTYVSRDGYTAAAGISAPDGTHPDAAGYTVMDTLNRAVLDPLL